MGRRTSFSGHRYSALISSGRAPTGPAGGCRHFAIALLCLLGLVLVSGCASTKVSNREQLVKEKLPRPDQVLVYDFAATPADVPADSAVAKNYSVAATSQTPEQIATGRKLGTEIAERLVEDIRDMGMPGRHAVDGAVPKINDIVIRGYLISVEQGRTGERLVIGFGAGGSELKVAVEGFQMTAHGLRKLGSGDVEAKSGKTPGAALGAATFAATANPVGLIVVGGTKLYGEMSGRSKIEGRAKQISDKIAEVLKKRFQEEGWID